MFCQVMNFFDEEKQMLPADNGNEDQGKVNSCSCFILQAVDFRYLCRDDLSGKF